MKKLLLVALCLIQTIAFSQDIIVTGYSGGTEYDQYEEYAVDVTLKNAGIVNTTSRFNLILSLSVDDQWQSSDIFLGSSTIDPVTAGQSVVAKITRERVNAAPGSYYLVIKADNQNYVSETDENNNVLVIPNFVVNVPDVDFALLSFAMDKAVYTQNSKMKPSYTLTNLGSTNTGDDAFTAFVVSKDVNFSADDIRLRHYVHILTGPDNIPPRTDDYLLLPNLSPGVYYLIAWADHAYNNTEYFQETNENNNKVVVPITVAPSDVDLIITNVQFPVLASYEFEALVTVKNQGTSGVGNFNTLFELVDQNGVPQMSSTTYADAHYFDYLEAGESKEFYMRFSYFDAAEGQYFARYTINPSYMNTPLPETYPWNNEYTDYFNPIVIESPEVKYVVLDNVSVSGIVDDTDQLIKVNLGLRNAGTVSGFTQEYTIEIADFNNTMLFAHNTSILINMAAGQSANKQVTLNLPRAYSVGNYKVSVRCTNSYVCNTMPQTVSKNFAIVPTKYNLTGIIKGEDNGPITKGKLFLYQDDGENEVRFIQKIDPYNASSFTFPIDVNKHTLYFIPDPVAYPQYVPTIYGKTLTLGSSNFFNTTSDMNVVFEILKVQSPPPGNGIINGSVVSGAEAGRLRSPLDVTSLSGIPVALISNDGKVVGFTHTNDAGFYEFNNLKAQEYKVMLFFELDHVNRMEPFPVDITNKNMTVDFQMTTNGVDPKGSQYYLPQEITFSAFGSHRYGDSPITLDAQIDSGLPIQYQTSDNTVADIVDGKVIIKGVGTVTITAVQTGTEYYSAASSERQLTIEKGLQSITFDPLQEKTYGDDPFAATATSTSEMSVTFSSSNTEIASVEGNTITIHGAGDVEIIAEQNGSTLYEAATTVKQTLSIAKAAQLISFDALDEVNSDAGSIELTATTSSDLTIVYESSDEEILSIDGNIATIKQAGTVNITARQSGNQNYLEAEDVVQQLVINVVLGLPEFTLTRSIYPNPTRGIVFVDVPGITSVEVFDLLGKPALHAKWNQQTIDFSQVENGVYLLKVRHGDQTLVTRVIKN
jgi:hypothetical protein